VVLTVSRWFVLTVVFVFAVLSTLPVLSVVLCLWTLCLLGCLLVLASLFVSLLRLATLLTLGLWLASRTTLSFEGLSRLAPLLGSPESVLLCYWRTVCVNSLKPCCVLLCLLVSASCLLGVVKCFAYWVCSPMDSVLAV